MKTHIIDKVTKPSSSVFTDKADYAPGETALVTATNFALGSTVEFQVQHVTDPGADGLWGTLDDVLGNNSGSGHDPWKVTDGGAGDLDGVANGTIQTNWYVNPDDSLNERFLLAATGTGHDGVAGTKDDQVATASFTDALDTDLTVAGSSATIGGGNLPRFRQRRFGYRWL